MEETVGGFLVVPVDVHGGFVQDGGAVLGEAVVEVDVFVDAEVFVPAADGGECFSAVDAEGGVVGFAECFAVVVVGVANAEGVAECEGVAFALWGGGSAVSAAADAGCVGVFFESGDACADVVG